MTDRAERNSQSIQSTLKRREQFYYYLPTLFQYPAPQQYWGLTSNEVVTRGVGAYHRNDKRQLYAYVLSPGDSLCRHLPS